MKNLKMYTVLGLFAVLNFTACEKKVDVQDPNAAIINQNTNNANVNEGANDPQQEVPAKIKSFLSEIYPKINVSKYEMKSKSSGNEYEVKLDNGVEVEFDQDENWTEIKDYNGVPEIFVPEKVKNYVTTNYKGIKIKKIERNASKNKMDVDLLNGVDLDFDMDGNFLKID